MPPIVADWLTPSAVCAKLKRRAPRVGGMLRWAQILLAQELCDLGIWIDKQELGDAEQAACAREPGAALDVEGDAAARQPPSRYRPSSQLSTRLLTLLRSARRTGSCQGEGSLGRGPVPGAWCSQRRHRERTGCGGRRAVTRAVSCPEAAAYPRSGATVWLHCLQGQSVQAVQEACGRGGGWDYVAYLDSVCVPVSG